MARKKTGDDTVYEADIAVAIDSGMTGVIALRMLATSLLKPSISPPTGTAVTSPEDHVPECDVVNLYKPPSYVTY